MIMMALAGVAMSLAVQQTTDTTFAVQANGRLELSNYGGEVVVKAWDRPQVRVRAEHSRRDSLFVRNTESVVALGVRSRLAGGSPVDYEITVPATMAVAIKGTYTDISIEGTKARIIATTTQGDVIVRGGADQVTAKSVEGVVEVSGTRGRVEARSVNRSVRVSDIVGDISAESINGSVTITGADAANVDAATVNGPVFYDGTLKSGGLYTLTSHNGAVIVALPDRPDVNVSVATMQGSFSSSFPVAANDSTNASSVFRKRRRFSVTLGNGAAKVEAESFGGAIRLVRKGEYTPSARRD